MAMNNANASRLGSNSVKSTPSLLTMIEPTVAPAASGQPISVYRRRKKDYDPTLPSTVQTDKKRLRLLPTVNCPISAH